MAWWTFASDLGVVGTVGGLLLWLLELVAAVLGCAYLWELSYKYFFAVSQPSRNERDGAIFAGTMGLIRRRALQEVGGWAEWCITEDAELSLRLCAGGGPASTWTAPSAADGRILAQPGPGIPTLLDRPMGVN